MKGLWETMTIVVFGFMMTYQELDVLGRLKRWWVGMPQIEEEKALQALRKVPSKRGYTCIITGANSGVGFETALHLASTGYHIILACRSEALAISAINQIKKSKGEEVHLEFMQLDLGKQQSIRDFASKVKSRNLKVDCLINNAGVMWAPKGCTAEGIETHFGVNYIGHYLLTLLLLPIMTEPSRILLLGSSCSSYGSIPFNDINLDKSYNKFYAYSNSKLAMSHFVRTLSQKLQQAHKNISVFYVDPGTATTEITKSMPLVMQLMYKTVGKLIFKNQFQGACCSIYAALAEELEGKSGLFLFEGQPMPSNGARSGSAWNTERQQLWVLSEKLANITFPF